MIIRHREKQNAAHSEPSAAGGIQEELLVALSGPDLAPSLRGILFDEIDNEVAGFACHQWVADYVERVASDHPAELLIAMRKRFMHVLEETDLLTRCGEDERLQLESRLSNLIEQMGYYVDAVEIITGGRGDDAVKEMLSKLQISGCVYHPRKRLSVLLCLFIISAQLMETHFRDLLTVLRSHDIALWARHPFGLLWVKILSHFVQHIYGQTDRLATDTATKQTMVLALETLERICEKLGTNAGLFDQRLHHALMLRLCSQMNIREPEHMLDRAVRCLVANPMGPLHTGSLQYDDADYVANLIENTTQTDTETGEGLPTGRFYTNHAELRLDGHNISIAELGVPQGEAYEILPGRVTLWHNINVSLGSKLPKDLRGRNDDSIDYYKSIWRHAEEVLTSNRAMPSQTQNSQRLEEGEGTEIIVCRQADNCLFECRIVEEGREGTGTLNVQGDVVRYYPAGVSIASFWYQGKPLVIEAYVKTVKPDGTYEFALIENIHEDVSSWCKETVTPGTRLRCLVNNRTGNAERAPGISDQGFSMSIGVPDGHDISDLRKGMVVEVGDIKPGYNGYLQGTFVRELPDTPFNQADSLHALMLWYTQRRVFTASEPPEETPADGAPQPAEQNVIEQRHVEELLAIIDAKATIEEDYKKAYHYLSFCHLLTCLLGIDERKAYYDSRLTLVEVLDDFATNGKVDEAKVRDLAQRYESLLQRNPALQHDLERLQIISCLNSNSPADAERLFHWSGPQSEPLLQQLAALVLSHNYVRKAELLPQSKEIRERINDLLRLSRNDTKKRHYGREDFYTEFKTSAVYPPNAMVPDLTKQMHNILRVICGFFNAEGGTLYIGVNDQGYTTGIEEDLKAEPFHYNPSTYQSFIENSIVNKMSQEAGHHMRTHFEENDSVLVVEITPCPNPIKLENHYYERMGTQTRQVNENYLQEFLNQRRTWAEQHRSDVPTASATPQPAPTETGTTVAPDTDSAANSIPTATRRNNVLHDYEPGYEDPLAIICLMDGGKYRIIDKDDWQDCALKLAIHESERDGWLVIVYANGYVAKISLDDLLKRERWKDYRRQEDTQAVFASIATKEDALILCAPDSNGQLHIRIDDISPIPTDGMQGEGTPLTDLPIPRVHGCNILPISSIPSDLPRNAPRKSRGVSVATNKGQRMMALMA